MTPSEAGKLGAIASKPIMEAAQLLRIEKYSKEPNYCDECNVALIYKYRHNKFCSNSCSASYNNKKRIKKNKNDTKYHCSKCSEGVKSAKTKLCFKCYRGDLTVATAKFDCTRRTLLIKECGIKCQLCYRTEWNDKPIPIELDHIDGNSNNNVRENLRLICPNCHAQTDTYKGKNIGNGRAYRREKYAKEKLKEKNVDVV